MHKTRPDPIVGIWPVVSLSIKGKVLCHDQETQMWQSEIQNQFKLSDSAATTATAQRKATRSFVFTGRVRIRQYFREKGYGGVPECL